MGEAIGILFDLLPGLTYSNVIDALSLVNGGDMLMVGIHVQSIGSNSGSVSFVNSIVSSVPEPGQWLMMLSWIMVMALRALRRS